MSRFEATHVHRPDFLFNSIRKRLKPEPQRRRTMMIGSDTALRVSTRPRESVKFRAGPEGVHFFYRSTALNVLLDEIQVLPKSWSRAPRYISMALTNACDLSCPYCYAPKHSAVIDYESVASWLGELDSEGCLGVGFGGGEPTLYPRFPELCRYTCERTSLAVSVTTHAHRLTPNLLLALEGNVHFIRISMDGVGRTYEDLRGRSFSVLRERIKSVKRISFFGINYVVNARTIGDVDRAAQLAVEWGAREFLLLPEQPVHGAGGIDKITKERLRDWVAKHAASPPLTISEAGADGMPLCTPVPGESGLRAFAHVDATGVLKRSSFAQNGVEIGKGGIMESLDELKFETEAHI
jgi:sulfatase maturation enzyme AslB (radical SAM superfamily)